MPDVAAVNANRRVPAPINEPIRSYAPGTPERASLKTRLDAMRVPIDTLSSARTPVRSTARGICISPSQVWPAGSVRAGSAMTGSGMVWAC